METMVIKMNPNEIEGKSWDEVSHLDWIECYPIMLDGLVNDIFYVHIDDESDKGVIFNAEKDCYEYGLQVVSIDDPRNCIFIGDYKDADEFDQCMTDWYNEHSWELPANEDFYTYYNETMEEIKEQL